MAPNIKQFVKDNHLHITIDWGDEVKRIFHAELSRIDPEIGNEIYGPFYTLEFEAKK